MFAYDDKQYKDVFAVDNFSWFLENLAFSKKAFKTKEDVIEKFKEIFPDQEIEKIDEGIVRFCWWTEDHSSYEYPNEDVRQVCGYRISDKQGRGAVNCWIVRVNIDWDKFFYEEQGEK